MADDGATQRAVIGDAVRAALAARADVLRIPSPTLEIYVARDFLSAALCSGLNRLIDAKRMPSQLLAPAADPEFRTSESCNLDPRQATVVQVERKIAALIKIDRALGEAIQGQRYAIGQQFKPHHDFFHEGEAYWDAMQRTGGQRTWTAMAFLNVPDEGGETFFPSAGIKVTPRTGNLLIWNNMDGDGHPNPASVHQGMPVLAGTKYVITKWYRERPWSYAPVATY